MFPHYTDRSAGAWNGEPRIRHEYCHRNNRLKNTKGHAPSHLNAIQEEYEVL